MLYAKLIEMWYYHKTINADAWLPIASSLFRSLQCLLHKSNKPLQDIIVLWISATPVRTFGIALD